LPFGTMVFIPGFGERIVQDRTAKRFGHRIDVYVGSSPGAHKRALRLGKRNLEVRILK